MKAIRTFLVFCASLCLSGSLLVVGSGVTHATPTTYCYGGPDMCWTVKNDFEAYFEGEFDIYKGPPGQQLFVDSVTVYIQWLIQGSRVYIGEALVQMGQPATTSMVYYYSGQKEALNHLEITYDNTGSDFNNETGVFHPDQDLDVGFGEFVGQYNEMQVSMNLNNTTPGPSSSWMFQVRSPIMVNEEPQDFPDSLWRFEEAEDLPSEPIYWGWPY